MKSRIITEFRISYGCFRCEVTALRMFLVFVVFIVVRITSISVFSLFYPHVLVKGGTLLAQFKLNGLDQALGFYNNLILKKVYWYVDEDL